QQLTDWLTDLGYEISKSSVHRFGKKHEQKMQAVSLSTQAAIYMAERNPDDAGALSSTVITMMQSEFFNALVQLQTLDDDKDAD
ncbi:phage protein Gp27 family protein, partial [Pseudoalteromonas sp. SIMBA_148]